MPEAPALSAENISVKRGPRTLLNDVTLHAQRGALLAIVGPNGAGKSTLLKTLAGLVPHQGSVHVAGQALSSLSFSARARCLGYVPQQSLLTLGASVAQVVAMGRYAHQQRLLEAHQESPEVDAALLRTGLIAMRGRAFHTLSGGEQRRVLLARALASGARILLLDEPTAGLDVAYVLRFFVLVRELVQDGYAVISALHDLADVRRHADTVLLLHRGASLAFGDVRATLTAVHVERAYGVTLHEDGGLGYSLSRGSS